MLRRLFCSCAELAFGKFSLFIHFWARLEVALQPCTLLALTVAIGTEKKEC